ncbi:MAG: homocysteine S-methyltransferase family protein [Rectinemataceae bacterium]|nr:homocysteine S-methyltransferase family protein [Rectinemataceae bacterium]
MSIGLKRDDRPLLGERLILADGSTGTALEALAPEIAATGRLALLPLERPDLVEALHVAYFEAGSELVETATFSASARDLETFAREWSGGVEALCYSVNKAAASLAVKAARKASRRDQSDAASRLRLVAGSMGPGDAPPSLGASTYAELFASYLPQARGLADGGADLAIIETCQDPLQIKAAIAALGSPSGGRGLPCIVSATVDSRGRMLAGADIAAFVAIVSPFKPLALGLNCSGGPDELAGPLEELASLSPLPLCLMPNAGLPSSVDGCTSYPFGPEVFAQKMEALARRFGIAVVGGCCGTSPAHIAALDALLQDRPRASVRPAVRPALASLYRARYFGSGLFKIGERANSAGSAAFAALLDADNFEGMADKALAQEESGAAAIDLHLSRPGRDEAADIERLVSLLAARAQSALCLDSGDPAVLSRILPLIGGRPLINSTSLEDPERARRVFILAREFGAAVVCLAMDGAGPARSVAEKVRICRSLYDMATAECGLSPEALLFDPLTFTVAAGGNASTTIEAISAIKAACPGSLTVLGVGNVSYGLPKAVRPAVTSLFTQAAVTAGLDAAIMDTAGIPAPESINPELKAAARSALGLDGEDRAEGSDPLDGLLAWAAEQGKGGQRPPPGPAGGDAAPAPTDPASMLAAALSRGDAGGAEAAGKRLAEAEGADRLTSVVTSAMAESGRLWNEGLLSLPLVLRSAEAARRALAPLAASAAGSSKGSIVMATVKGDLHDIGKNIVSAILACSGWKIVDLGTDVPTQVIVEAARSQGALAVGLSGLLTRSLTEMKGVCETLHSSGIKSLVLCGGAAVDPSFVAREVEPRHPGLVRSCADAFEAAAILETFARTQASEKSIPETSPSAATALAAAEQSHSAAPGQPAWPSSPARKSAAFELPFPGASEPLSIPFEELLALVERKVLFSSRWGYRREDYPAAEEALEKLLPEARRLAEPKAVYGYFRCRRAGETLLGVQVPNTSIGSASEEEILWRDALDLPFPVEKGGKRRTIAAYFSPEADSIAFFAVTTGAAIARAARALKDEGRLEDYWRLHGLGSSLAEASAQWIHERIGRELATAGATTRGRRYSFGFPACPGTEHQDALLEILGASRIGIRATAGHQLDPEHSVTAFIVARPDAVYFDA